MLNKKIKTKSVFVLLCLFIPLIFQIFSVVPQSTSNSMINDRGDLHTSAFVSSNMTQWLNDTSFNYPANWTSSINGDSTDVNSSISGGEASFTVKGEKKTFSEVSGEPTSSDWTETLNPDYPGYPTTHNFVGGTGIYIQHIWEEDPWQEASVHYERNISIVDEMPNYIITSASIVVTVNARVYANDGNNAGIEGSADYNLTGVEYATGDFIQFYARVSDLSKNKKNNIAWNQTHESLGDDSHGQYSVMDDTNLTSVAEKDLINYLTSALSTDNHNFTLTLGLRIHCEDNYYFNGKDWFDYIYITRCDLSFTYEKKISQLTTISHNQECDKIGDLSDDYIVYVTNANLTFYYKIDQEWPTTLSPSSEIRILINNNPFPETIKLEKANTTFQISTTMGYDITSYITEDVNFSIQLYIRDEFGLNRTIKISFDNISLMISYNLLTIDLIPPPWIETYGWLVGLLAAGLVGIGSYFTAYQIVFKYPKFVRKIRKLRKKVKKEKKLKRTIDVESRNKIVSSRLREKMSSLRIEPMLERAGTVALKQPGANSQVGNLDKVLKGGPQQ